MLKIIKLPSNGESISGFLRLLNDKGVKQGDKFALKFKKGRRWKLKKFFFINGFSAYCDCCGLSDYLTLQKGSKYVDFDNHLGVGWVQGKYIFDQIS
jgi:hypothetical protein